MRRYQQERSETPGHVLPPIRMVGVGELQQLNGCAVFDDERDAHAIGWAVRRNQNFSASQFGCKVTHLKSNMWHLPDQLGNRCVRFEPHPFHAILAVFVSDNKDLQALDVALSRPWLAGRNSNVVISTHFFTSVPNFRILRDHTAGPSRTTPARAPFSRA